MGVEAPSVLQRAGAEAPVSADLILRDRALNHLLLLVLILVFSYNICVL